MEIETKVIMADAECYSTKYYEKYNRVDEYIVGGEDIDTLEFFAGTNFKGFINEIREKQKEDKRNVIIYFHNGGKYDYWFLLSKLYTYVKKDNVKIIMDASKNIFEIRIKYQWKEDGKRYTRYLTFRDSVKIWPLKLAILGDAVGLPKLDYGEYDILDEFATVEEYKQHNGGKSWEYFKRDIRIMTEFARLTAELKDIRDYKLTIASTAYSSWQETFTEADSVKWWLKTNPKEEVVINKKGEEEIKKIWENNEDVWFWTKKAYKGGITWVNPIYQLKKLYKVYVYDINSMYPSIMMNEKLPYGWPSLDENKPGYTYKLYRVYIKKASTEMMPFLHTICYDSIERLIQGRLEGGDDNEIGRGYFKEFENAVVYMNNYTLDYFKKTYEADYEVEFLYSMKEDYGMFNKYIEFYKNIKEDKSRSKAVITLAKFFLNSLTGKFGQNIIDESSVVEMLDEVRDMLTFKDNSVWYGDKLVTIMDDLAIFTEEEGLKRDFSFIPLVEAITSKARIQLTKAINDNWEAFVYCDTDSIHLTKEAKGLNLDPKLFGAWDFEGCWDEAVYRRPKHYAHWNDNGDFEIKGGGLAVGSITREDMPIERYLQPDFVYEYGKVNAYTVDGGKLIEASDYNFSMPGEWHARKKSTH